MSRQADRVRVIELKHGFVNVPAVLVYEYTQEHLDPEDEAPLTRKAYKSLKNVNPGDIVDIDRDRRRHALSDGYPIVWARPYTGSVEERIDALEARVAELEKILGAQQAAEERIKTPQKDTD